VRWDGVVGAETERSALRIRLVAVALGTTIVLLGAGPYSLPAALILAAYSAAASASPASDSRIGRSRAPRSPSTRSR